MAERIVRASCKFCQDSDRDALEEMLTLGIVTPKDLDKQKGWREGTLIGIFATTWENITWVVIANVVFAYLQKGKI